MKGKEKSYFIAGILFVVAAVINFINDAPGYITYPGFVLGILLFVMSNRERNNRVNSTGDVNNTGDVISADVNNTGDVASDADGEEIVATDVSSDDVSGDEASTDEASSDEVTSVESDSVSEGDSDPDQDLHA